MFIASVGEMLVTTATCFGHQVAIVRLYNLKRMFSRNMAEISSEICKKQRNGLAGSRDADGRRKNTQQSNGVETNG
jgi:hypothetical protein